MKCFSHPDNDAVGQCSLCGKGLCKACGSRFERILCDACATTHNRQIVREMWIGLGITVAIPIVVTWILVSYKAPFGRSLIIGLLLAGTNWGWKFLSAHFPRMTGGSSNVWLVYLTIKLMASSFIGIFVGPYQIYRMIRELRTAREAVQFVERPTDRTAVG